MRNSSYKHFDSMEVVYYSHNDVLFVSKPHTNNFAKYLWLETGR